MIELEETEEAIKKYLKPNCAAWLKKLNGKTIKVLNLLVYMLFHRVNVKLSGKFLKQLVHCTLTRDEMASLYNIRNSIEGWEFIEIKKDMGAFTWTADILNIKIQTDSLEKACEFIRSFNFEQAEDIIEQHFLENTSNGDLIQLPTKDVRSKNGLQILYLINSKKKEFEWDFNTSTCIKASFLQVGKINVPGTEKSKSKEKKAKFTFEYKLKIYGDNSYGTLSLDCRYLTLVDGIKFGN